MSDPSQIVAWATANKARTAIIAVVAAIALYWAYKRYYQQQPAPPPPESYEDQGDKKEKAALKGNFLVADKVANDYKQGQKKSVAEALASAMPIVPANVQLPSVDAQLKPVSSTMGSYDKVFDVRGPAAPEQSNSPTQTLTQVSPAYLDAKAASFAKAF